MLLKYKIYFIYYLLIFPLSYGIYALFYKYLYVPNIPIVQMFLGSISFIFIIKFGKRWIFFEKIISCTQLVNRTSNQIKVDFQL